ncbi:MAG: metallophosphoesterase [Terriglobales bacterium]
MASDPSNQAHLVIFQSPRFRFALPLVISTALFLIAFAGCTRNFAAQTAAASPADAAPVALSVSVEVPFRFVAYGDTRFHNPADTEASNSIVRVALVRAIADANPAFICFTGDIVYNGYDENDWKTFDSETGIWREKHIPVFPALGNHEFHGDEKTDLANYFARFRELKNSRYYSVRAGNALFLVLDSSVDEVSGPQGQWLTSKLDTIPSDVDFVFVMLHHPPYTSSSMNMRGEGHSARSSEQALARLLEERQAHARARFVVFSGHVHNYERHDHGGVTYFVSGGGGAHAYPVRRAPEDPYQSKEVNYHYLLLEVDQRKLKVTMNRLQLEKGKAVWTQPDSITISAPAAQAANAAAR